jgi:hypothetical protein
MTDRIRSDRRSECVFVRRSTILDLAALSQLAARSGRAVPRGLYLIAEVGGRIVAATSLDRREAPLGDPAADTADIQHLLRRWGSNLQRDVKGIESRAA